MTTFQQFLEKKAKEQRHPERRQRREEWIAAVGQLIQQIRSWLEESDPNHFLDVVPVEVERVEPALGLYRVPSLSISVGAFSVEVDPVGRDALGFLNARNDGAVRAEGRVDVTDGVRKYTLYRTLQNGQPEWYAIGPDYRPVLFDRSKLETILQDLLS